MYDVRRLRLLRELSYRGTLAAVAEALGHNPSSVSHQLTVLEREVGVHLLEPAGRGVRLTDEGRLLAGHAEAVLYELERAEAAIAAARDRTGGTVRVATFQSAAHALIPEVATRLAAEHPALCLVVTHLDADLALPALVARDFDLVLFEEYPGVPTPPVSGVTTEVLLEDPLRLLSPRLDPTETVAAAAERLWAMEPPASRAGGWARAVCRAAGFEPEVRYSSADLLLHLTLVRGGLTVALVPELALIGDGIHVAELPDGPTRAIRMAHRSGARRSPALTTTIDALRAAVQRRSAGCSGGPDTAQ